MTTSEPDPSDRLASPRCPMLRLTYRLRNLVYASNWLWRLRIGSYRPGRSLIMSIYTPLWYYLHDRGAIDDDGWPTGV